MKRYLFLVTVLTWPLLSFGQTWVRSQVPYLPDAREAYELRPNNTMSCFVGRIPRRDAVIFHFWERKKTVSRKDSHGRLISRAQMYSIFDEGVLDAESAKLKEFNLGRVFHSPGGNSPPNLREGAANFRHLCQEYASTIPSRYVRDVMVRFKKQVEKTSNPDHLFIDGKSSLQ